MAIKTGTPSQCMTMKIHSRFFMSFRLRPPESTVSFVLSVDRILDFVGAPFMALEADHIVHD
jgi:hypothetical protein